METDLKRISEFYETYMLNHPDGGGWPSFEQALNVYKTSSMSNIIPWRKITSVIDVGSAMGFFLTYLRKEIGYIGDYYGIEILEGFHDKSIKTHINDKRANFLNSDFLSLNFEEKFDWGFCIGALGTKTDKKEHYDNIFISKMCELSRMGLTIYINNKKHFSEERLKQVPDLYAHYVPDIVNIVFTNKDIESINITNYPMNDYRSCAINILFK